MKEIRIGIKILKTLIKESYYNPSKIVAEIIVLFTRCGLLLLLYHYVFGLRGNNILGTGFKEVAWSIYFYFIFSNIRIRDLPLLMMNDIQSGNIEIILCRPVSYLWYRCIWQLGLGALPFLVGTTLMSFVLYFAIGIPEIMSSPFFFPVLFLVFIFCIILSLLVYSLIGLMAFLIEDVSSLLRIFDKSIMILGGSFLPIALFPKFLKNIAIYSPLGATHFISHVMTPSWKDIYFQMILLQIFWIIVFLFLNNVVFNFVSKKVSVNGG